MPTSDSLGTDFLEADILIPHHFDDYIFNHGFLSGEWSPGRDRVDAILGRPGRPRRPRYGYGGEWESKPVIPGRLVRPQPQPLRRRECEEVGAQLLRPSPGIVVIAGKPGSGRSAMVAGVATAIRDADRTRRLRQIGGDLEEEMGQALDYLDHRGEMDDEVIVIDDFERYLDIGVFARKVALASGEFGARFLLVVDERHTFRFNEVSAELADAAHIVTVDELPADELPDIVAHAVAPLARATRVDIDREVITAALAPADASEPRRHPGLAIRRIDEAIGRARLEGTRTLRADHLALPKVERPQGANALARRLARRVRGQDEAIATVARFVGPALAGLKDQPGAPHATLMFAGPTGVGKTELAKELAAAAYGSSDALIALDMSEYADAQDGLAKLIGHHRSWKNSSTEGLLTTRVIERPRSVVLLDEFEKSHPMVWQTFLQVFDEGRLTDGWGQTASFSEAIIILTSNLGARDGASRGAGFGATGGFRADKQLAAIAERFPPELRNRITAIVPFVPLDLDAIVEICEAELARAAERFGSAGWRIDYDDDVVRRLAEAGFDPALGARHIKRNIRGELLPLLADASTRDVRVVAGVDGLSLECAA